HVTHGYATSGQPVKIDFWGYAPFPYLAILPTGPTELAGLRTRGLGAPRPTNTVSTSEEEQEMMFISSIEEEECHPAAVIECNPSTGGGQRTGIVLPSGRRRGDCYRTTGFPQSVDIDRDNVLDTCEFELAYEFRPRMAFDLDDDNLDREPYWAVRHVLAPVEAFRIFYAISYREDGGIPIGGFFAHQGDSEWIIIEVNTDEPHNPGVWVVKRATLSAHWGAPSDGTATYAGEDLEYADVYLGRPVIWVAEDKHANYRSQSVCDAGAFYTDACNHGGDRGETVEVLPFATGNLGQGPNRGVILIDCIGSRRGFPRTECFWTEPEKFRGWLATDPNDGGAGPYHLSLTFFGF
ncbi:MAG: hypothetical protein ACREON_19840, partial [Gemmatimonadaceae bacterium]